MYDAVLINFIFLRKKSVKLEHQQILVTIVSYLQKNLLSKQKQIIFYESKFYGFKK
jgi:hypothetical protein